MPDETSEKPTEAAGVGVPMGPPWLPPSLTRGWIDVQWALGALTLLASSVVFLGWRGLLHSAVAAMTAHASHKTVSLVMRMAGREGVGSPWLHVTTLGLLAGLAIPLTRDASPAVIAGAVVGLLTLMTGRTKRLRLNAPAAAVLVVWLLPTVSSLGLLRGLPRDGVATVDRVLCPTRVVLGDVSRVDADPEPGPWWSWSNLDGDAGERARPGNVVLRDRARFLLVPDMLVNTLGSGELCRMEELLLGCVPAGAGTSSVGLVVFVGMMLMYRRLSWWPMALAGLFAALAVFAFMPVGGMRLGEMVWWHVWERGFAEGLTYVGYMVLATPLPVVLLIFAPMSAPMGAGGRLIYAALVGAIAMAALWFTGSPASAFVGVAAASLVSRWLDGVRLSRFWR